MWGKKDTNIYSRNGLCEILQMYFLVSFYEICSKSNFLKARFTIYYYIVVLLKCKHFYYLKDFSMLYISFFYL